LAKPEIAGDNGLNVDHPIELRIFARRRGTKPPTTTVSHGEAYGPAKWIAFA